MFIFQHFGVLISRYIHIVYFAQPNNIENLWSLVIYYRDVNWLMIHFQIVNRAIVESYHIPNKILKKQQFCPFCSPFNYGNFHYFGELKTRFLEIVHFAQPNNLGNSFGVWKFIILLL